MIMILHVFLQTRHIEKISTGWVNLSPFWAETIQSFPNQIWILNWWIQFYSQHSRSQFGLHDSLGSIGAENPGANGSSVRASKKFLFLEKCSQRCFAIPRKMSSWLTDGWNDDWNKLGMARSRPTSSQGTALLNRRRGRWTTSVPGIRTCWEQNGIDLIYSLWY